MIDPRSRVYLALCLLAGCGQDPEPAATGSSKERPAGIDPAALDRHTSPCNDFYQFACGGWIAARPLSASASFDSTFLDPFYREVGTLRPILRQAADTAGTQQGDARLVGNYHRACLAAPQETRARQRVLELQSKLDVVQSIEDLAGALAMFDRLGSSSFFWMFVGTDLDDPSRHVLGVAPGGMELPDRSYYLDAEDADLRQRYLEHIRTLARLLNVSVDADAVLAIESALASASPTPAEERDPRGAHHPMSLDELSALAPHFPWSAYLAALGVPASARIDAVSPTYLMALDRLLVERPLTGLRDYVRWQVIEDEASKLDQEFLDEEFAFHGRLFNGLSAPVSRDWHCYQQTTGRLGFQIARQYLDRLFDPGQRPAQRALIQEIKTAMRARLAMAPWLDDATRAEAQAKLDKLTEKIGYPDVWPSLPEFDASGTWLDANLARNEAYHARAVISLGAPVDRSEWLMAPIEVNAYYGATTNEIVFPAAIFSLPFFDPASGAAVNHGAIGAVMGHELTHAFDDAGRQFDGDGALRNWWTPGVEAAFAQRTSCLVDAFSRREPLPGQHVDGIRTLGENIADLGGLNLAFDAWKASGALTAPVAGFSGDQQFFIGYAQMYCARVAPQYQETLLATDPHAPMKERVNVPLSQLDAFAEAFHCSAGSPMRPRPACAVW
jgi:putative endopeptidase